MTNTRIIQHEFAYHAPVTMKEALSLLKQPDAVVLAGGTDLINKLKLETVHPAHVVYLGAVEELSRFNAEDGLTIGSMVPMIQVERAEEVRRNYECLYEAVNSVGGLQIRNMATLSGNIANASPAADVPPSLMVLEGKCELSRLSEQGEIEKRMVPVEAMFTGPGKNVLADDEIITGIVVPFPEGQTGSAFMKNSRVKLDVAKASATVFIRREGVQCSEVRVVAGAVAPTPVRASHVEALLKGQSMTRENLEKAAGAIEKDIKPISDVRSTDSYRMRIMRVLVRDALMTAWTRSGGKELE